MHKPLETSGDRKSQRTTTAHINERSQPTNLPWWCSDHESTTVCSLSMTLPHDAGRMGTPTNQPRPAGDASPDPGRAIRSHAQSAGTHIQGTCMRLLSKVCVHAVVHSRLGQPGEPFPPRRRNTKAAHLALSMTLRVICLRTQVHRGIVTYVHMV